MHASIVGFWGVRYQVRDVQRAITFYTQTLGFNLDMQHLPAFGQVSRHGLKLILSGPGASGSRSMPDGRQQQPGGWNRVLLRSAGPGGADHSPEGGRCACQEPAGGGPRRQTDPYRGSRGQPDRVVRACSPAERPAPRVHARSTTPPATASPDRRHVLAVAADVQAVFGQPIGQLLLHVGRPGAELRQPIDRVAGQVKAIEIVQHRHVERRRDRAFFLVAAHVQVAVIRPAIGQPVNQPRIAVIGEDDRLVAW